MFPSFVFLGREIGFYAIFALIGILAAGFLAYFLSHARQKNGEDAIILGLWALLGALIGGHLVYGLTNLPTLRALFSNLDSIYADDFLSILGACFGGMVYYGGLVGGLLFAFFWAKKAHLDAGFYGDVYAVCLPLFHTFGRIGCFFGGCCYGVECPFGFVMHHAAVEEANGVTRFPVQLLESALNLLLFFALLLLFRRKKAPGKLMAWYLILYALMRFGLEFLRGDALRGGFWIFSTSQWFALGFLLLTPLWLFFRAKRNAGRVNS